MTPLPPLPRTLWPKSWSYVDFKMATQPKFELGICGIIQNVFQDDKTIEQKFEKLLEKKLLFSIEIINIFLEPFPYSTKK